MSRKNLPAMIWLLGISKNSVDGKKSYSLSLYHGTHKQQNDYQKLEDSFNMIEK